MNRTDYFNELDALKNDLDKWDYDSKFQRYTCHVGDITITVDKGRNGAHWKVEHDRFEMPDDAKGMDQVVAYAKRTAIDYARTWVAQNVSPSVPVRS